jgi:CheY-like chemotaxis protein
MLDVIRAGREEQDWLQVLPDEAPVAVFRNGIRTGRLAAEFHEDEAACNTKRTELSRPLRVLIVEDDDAVACGLRWSLEAEGSVVHVVGRGADALPAVLAFHPDVLVLDLSLPDENGRAVYDRITAVSLIPVIFSSGSAGADIDDLQEPSRTAFLTKPYSTDELLAAIFRLVKAKDGSDD